ncbi:MAG: hypothetical protein LC772_06875 [Chloroflexi bacterium]|nr:hypothetical protein [Chloroflexota bacterium]
MPEDLGKTEGNKDMRQKHLSTLRRLIIECRGMCADLHVAESDELAKVLFFETLCILGDALDVLPSNIKREDTPDAP